MSVDGLPVVGVGEVDFRGTHLVKLLAVAGDGVGEVDDVKDIAAAEAADLQEVMGAADGRYPSRADVHSTGVESRRCGQARSIADLR
jgi:hypothetical protein